MIGLRDIEEARARLIGVIRPTLTEYSESLSLYVGRDVWLKPEYRQRTGSYKIRGAYNMISR
ncbi:MAG TPA: pyridoxal-phosphate dependent enzyme, partial [Actinomycetota bacterium]|nr:pyridoxal-phosphate dependent enzyme [Actinomycetota bacterium]